MYETFHRYRIGVPLDIIQSNGQPKPGNNPDGCHAMLLIGILKETRAGVAKHYFLLQNWWGGKYFVVMTADYLALCHPQIVWIHKKSSSYPFDLQPLLNNYHNYAETSADHAVTKWE